jgi:PncC family amidohydrolase
MTVSPERDSLECRVGAALSARGWLVAAAESCTGGLILSRLTDIAGSSAYVAGGIVAYSYQAKMALLGVRAETLAQYGAVSAQTAAEMARGCIAQLGADIAVSVTGIAGPGGGTPDKPVGLVYIGLALRAGLSIPPAMLYDDVLGAHGDGVIVRRYVWDGDRSANKRASADAALRLILDSCSGG